jgi:hypothetical protein
VLSVNTGITGLAQQLIGDSSWLLIEEEIFLLVLEFFSI